MQASGKIVSFSESGPSELERQVGDDLHLKLNLGLRPKTNKHHEGKMSMRLAVGHCVSRSSGQGYPAHASFASSLNVDPTWALHVEVMKFKQ